MTDKSLIGKKALIRWGRRTLQVTIDGLCPFYPDTAYKVSWTKADNPQEVDIPDDCAGRSSQAHFSLIREVYA